MYACLYSLNWTETIRITHAHTHTQTMKFKHETSWKLLKTLINCSTIQDWVLQQTGVKECGEWILTVGWVEDSPAYTPAHWDTSTSPDHCSLCGAGISQLDEKRGENRVRRARMHAHTHKLKTLPILWKNIHMKWISLTLFFVCFIAIKLWEVHKNRKYSHMQCPHQGNTILYIVS